MKKLLIFIFLVITSYCQAQDLIYTKGGHSYEVKIVDQAESWIEFYFTHDEEKNVRKMNRANIAKVEIGGAQSQVVASSGVDATETSTSPNQTNDKAIRQPIKNSNNQSDPNTASASSNENKSTAKEPAESTATPEPPKERPKPTLPDVDCKYDVESGNNRLTKDFPTRILNVNAKPINLVKKFSIWSVQAESNNGEVFLNFMIKAQNDFSMKAGNKILFRLANGNVITLENQETFSSERGSGQYSFEHVVKLKVFDDDLLSLLEHRIVAIRMVLDRGLLTFSNTKRGSTGMQIVLMCVS